MYFSVAEFKSTISTLLIQIHSDISFYIMHMSINSTQSLGPCIKSKAWAPPPSTYAEKFQPTFVISKSSFLLSRLWTEAWFELTQQIICIVDESHTVWCGVAQFGASLDFSAPVSLCSVVATVTRHPVITFRGICIKKFYDCSFGFEYIPESKF